MTGIVIRDRLGAHLACDGCVLPNLPECSNKEALPFQPG